MKIQNFKVDSNEGTPVHTAASPDIFNGSPPASTDRHALEVAVLKAKIQHLELVIDMARSLLGSNQERLLRRLHEVPRELAALSSQLQRIDPETVW